VAGWLLAKAGWWAGKHSKQVHCDPERKALAAVTEGKLCTLHSDTEGWHSGQRRSQAPRPTVRVSETGSWYSPGKNLAVEQLQGFHK
jgi:hypothetical protein